MVANDKENTNVKERLEETVKHCVLRYEGWKSDAKNVEARQSLEEAVHELRKVTSRIEIELAISDRNNSSLKPMPIPPHRSSKPKPAKKIVEDNGRNNDKAEKFSDSDAKRGRRPKLKTVKAKAEPEE